MNKTAGIIIIGDEILKGRVVDENSNFLLKRLYKLGIKVKKLSFIPDDVNAIAREVSAFSKDYNFVIITGGTGPTHDDVTYAGVAQAFNEELLMNKELQEWVYSFTGERCMDVTKNPALKMAIVPKSSRLLYCKRGCTDTFMDSMPVVFVSNVYIFPGIPSYLYYLFERMEYTFKNDKNSIFFNQCLYLNISEFTYLVTLNHISDKYKDCVTFGSYPIEDNESYCTKISLESTIKHKVWEAEKFLISKLPEGSVVKKDTLHPDDLIHSIYFEENKLLECNLLEKINSSLKVINECLEKYEFSDICVSFNGGKDCTVLLHLICAVVWKRHSSLQSKQLKAVYISYDDPFVEVEDFISDAVMRYNLELITVPGPIKQALDNLLKNDQNIKAILMGTRRTDPYSASLASFQMTDADWPQVMRVHPIIDWSYNEIWTFLRNLEVPYCRLYDLGYTSIGSHQNTSPNPRLQYTADDGEVKYHPAYLLDDGSSERSGRN